MKLRPFDSESKAASGNSKLLLVSVCFRKKISTVHARLRKFPEISEKRKSDPIFSIIIEKLRLVKMSKIVLLLLILMKKFCFPRIYNDVILFLF